MEELNILLLGETGVGKSTFINAVANYLNFPNFKEAKEANDLTVLVPIKFNFFDNNRQLHSIEIGDNSDENENIRNIGESCTQKPKAHLLLLPNVKNIRLIDTPGVGGSQENWKENWANILSCLKEYKQIHAICILLKPTVTRSTASFTYCIKTILSQLDNSAANNIVFCFTNTRGSDFTPGDTLPCLEELLKQIKIEIPCKDNIFCFDNEAFKCLVANKKVPETINPAVEDSWEQSSREFKSMIKYVDGLTSHDVSKILCINKVRIAIPLLLKPLVDICEKRKQKEETEKKINDQQIILDDLRKFSRTVIKIYKKPTEPAMVCNSVQCFEIYQENGETVYHYKQRCHETCYLRGIEMEVVGGEELRKCFELQNGTCAICGCSYRSHMLINYETWLNREQVKDKTEEAVVISLKEMKESIEKINVIINKLEKEQINILEANAKIALFLQNNAILPFNDATEEHILALIEREQNSGEIFNQDAIRSLEDLHTKYKELKSFFQSTSDNFYSEDVQDVLKYWGKKLKEDFLSNAFSE